jgi:hypothetical protein
VTAADVRTPLNAHPHEAEPTATRHYLSRRTASLLLYLATVVLASAAVFTSVSRRVLPLVDIDEAGYLQFARSHYLALHYSGLGAYLDSVLHQAVFAPLVPAAGALAQFFAGGEPMSALMVNAALFAVVGVAAYLVGLQLGGPYVAWVTGLMSMGSLAMIDYASVFHFAEAVAAFSALGFYFALRSRAFESLTFSALMGAAIGLMALSRTMTLAFVPAFFVAGLLWILLTRGRRRRRILSLALGFGVMVLVAAPWYVINAAGIFGYLFRFGYGAQSREYGTESSGVLDAGSWQKIIRDFTESTVGPLIAVLVVVGLVLLFIRIVRDFRRRGSAGRACAAAPLLPLGFVALTLLFFLAALASSRNASTGFYPVLIVPVVVLAAVGLGSVTRLFWKRLLLLVVVLAFAVNTSVKAGLWPGLIWPQVPIAYGAPASVTTDRTIFDVYVSAPVDAAVTRQSISALTALVAAESPLTEVAFGFRHRLVNVNSVELAMSLGGLANFPTRMIDPQVLDPSEAGLRAWLLGGAAGPPCILLTAAGTSGEFDPSVDQDALARVAEKAGYSQTDAIPLGADRVILAWQNAAYCGKG